MSASNELTQKILAFLYENQAFAFRNNSLGIFDRSKGIFRTAPKKGISDILICHKSYFIACEIKIGKDKLSSEQIGFLKNIEHYGGVSMVVKDFEDFKKQWIDYLIHRGL